MNYILQGKVIKGEAIGRTIGFPTANLALARKPKIKSGVYAALVTLDKKNYLGLAYFGPRYIFKKKTATFEVFIFNFNRQIYGKKLMVKLLKFLRAPRPVKNLCKLKKMLQTDVIRLDQDVILVNRKDKIIGIADKIAAHRGRAELHRAISVQLFNKKNELLIQKRSINKQLFSGFWANTVCTDVRPYETYLQAAQRRLHEEFGLKAKLKPAFKFDYSARFDKNHSEREMDQVFIGLVVGQPNPNNLEISAWQYIALDQLTKSKLKLAPWFKLILKKLSASDIFNS